LYYAKLSLVHVEILSVSPVSITLPINGSIDGTFINSLVLVLISAFI